MSASEDEQQSLDAGWDDEPSADDEDVDQAWDSLPPPVSGVSGSSGPTSSMPPVTEAVDSGWDDVPEGAPGASGKRRPHRQRRAKLATAALPVAASPVLSPRPAEPSKKQQREHARKQKAREAQVKQQRKEERKAERAAEMRQEADQRQQQAEAEALERKQRREERERAERERPRPAKVVAAKPQRAVSSKRADATPSSPAPRASEPAAELEPLAKKPKGGLRPGVVVTLVVILGVLAFLLFGRK